ncbi:MAG: polysaccharide biosynthesis/export family protein [Bryobacterales bacterium]|nr:polysaccharide biosynthesis/export family protein [Bryobacterales bacterium]
MKIQQRSPLASFMRLARIPLGCMIIWCMSVLAQDAPKTDTPPNQDAGIPDQRLSANFPGVVDPSSYKIGPEDVIQIRVWREPELSVQQSVRPDGKITLPLIGDVDTNEATPKELSETIAEKLKEFINNPSVMVTVEQVRSKKYTITGEVGRPGSYPLLTTTTVLDALTNSGGFRDFANKKKIIIIRGTERIRFNYNEVIDGKNVEQNIELRNGDLIVVP